MKTCTRSRLLAALLVLVMVITLLPTAAFAAEGATATLVTDVSDLTAGDKVVVVAKDYDAALGTTQKDNNRASVAITKVGDTVTFDDTVQVLTLEDGVSDGTFALNTGSGYLYAASSSKNYLRTEATLTANSSWKIEIKDGVATVQAQGDNTHNWMRYNANNDLFACYGSGQQDIALYKVGEAEPEEVSHFVTDLAELKDGDQVIIYNPGSEMALSQTYNGFYNTGVALKLEEDQLTGYEDTEVWTIGVNEDGTYTFSTADGKKFAMGDSFSSTPLDEANPDWEISAAATEGCFYIQNVIRQLYLEWYADKGNWSAYKAISEDTEALFAHQIYKVIPTEEPDDPDAIFADGDRVVIYNPANMMALSQNYNGFYNLGVDVTMTGGVLSGYAASEVWTVGVNADGTYTFSTADGKKLAMGDSFSSMPLDEANPNWKVLPAATADCYYIQNAVRGSYVEWFADKDNWSSYGSIGNNEALFAQAFYKVEGDIPTPPAGDLPAAGDQVVIYNASAEGVIGLEGELGASMSCVPATVADGVATVENGGRVFTVSVDGSDYTFESGGKYLAANDAEELFLTETLDDYAKWTLDAQTGGYIMYNKAAKYTFSGGGSSTVCIEYYAGSFSGWTYKSADSAIFEFSFYPVAEGTTVTEGVVNKPAVTFNAPDAYVGQDYTFTFTVDAVFGVQELAVQLGDAAIEATAENGTYTVVIPAEQVKGESLTVTVSGTDTNGVAINGTATITVKDEPVISNVMPENNSETGDEKRPVISAEISNAGEDPTVTMTVSGEPVEAVYADGKVSYTPAADMADGRVNVTVTVARADGKSSSKSWSFTVGEATYQLYFGQLHSHTAYSDGSGTLQAALNYVAALPESANVDFVAFTDHSNYFDTTSAANPEQALYDMSLASESSQESWNTYKQTVAAFNASQSDIVAIAGFEMTWSGGPGHINTFNTPGIVSRNNTTLNNKTSDAGMKAYYALLSQPEGADSLSQFNHPGSTFGTFSDFSYWDALIDSRICMVEVGNGEGQIGAGGYFPSYEYYTMALDKGWHVAPTNNQDNHKGKWGNANDARDVILTDDFSEQGIYDAIRAMRMYATEDKNLELYYTVNGLQLGSSISEVPEKLDISVQVSDPDVTDSISKVEVIVNSGKVAYTWDDPAVLATGDLSCTLDPDYSYYYIRVTEDDGDLAVTAPVWVGETLKLGISSVECGTSTPVTGEELEITTTLFNSESSDATVKSVTYTTNGSVVLGTDTTEYTIPASGTQTVSFKYTPDVAKIMTITATVIVEQDGKEYTFSMDITLDVLDADELIYIGIDAAHYNEYVAGNYKDSMGNFSNLAAGYSVRTVDLKTSEALIAACSNEKYKAIILTAPSRRLADAQSDPRTYTQAELDAIAAFNAAGGTVVLAGWADIYENYNVIQSNADIVHMAETQNELLAALGSSLRISDDSTTDDEMAAPTDPDNGSRRLYFSAYNMDSFLVDGVEYDAEHPNDNLYTELYSQYGGASVYVVDADGNPTSVLPDTVSPIVFAHATSYSADKDEDGRGGDATPKYTYAEGDDRLMVLASEQLEGKGLIIVSGAAFMSNFEVQATLDNGQEKNYSNYRICENLVQYLNPVKVTDIAEVQRQTEIGYKYTIEGVVTSNASGYDKDTAFFDCIYVQDATGGICCFPVAGEYKIGDKVRITGTTDFYQGEMELQVTSITKLGEGEAVAPQEVTAAQINDGSVLGSLVTVKGTVQSFELANGLVQTIMVKDAEGNVARVFIDGYITTAKDVENLEVGSAISATGLASYDDTFNAPEGPFPRIRVRDRADIICTAAQEHEHVWGEWTVTKAATCTETGVETRTCSVCGETETREIEATGHTVVVDPAVAPTYDDTGLTEGSHCSVCNTVIKAQEIVPALGHKCTALTDIDMWAKSSICYMVENGYMVGMSQTTFEPNTVTSRAMVVAVLYRMAGAPDVSGLKNPFSDVADGQWYADAIIWAANNGIAAGMTPTTFEPEADVTRAQMVAFVMRYAAFQKQDVSKRADLTNYTDAAAVPDWAKDNVQWAVAEGLIVGVDETTLAPNDTATRAQLATILANYLSK